MTTLLEIPSEFPVRVERREGVGNVLVATRDLRPLEVVLQDPQALPHGPLATQDSPGMVTNTISDYFFQGTLPLHVSLHFPRQRSIFKTLLILLAKNVSYSHQNFELVATLGIFQFVWVATSLVNQKKFAPNASYPYAESA